MIRRGEDLRFIWKDYDPLSMPFIENWLDEYAVKMTGMDDGWRSFHEYWITEGGLTPGVDYWCKVVYEGEKPVAIIAFSLYEGTYTIMELLVKHELRGHGIGTSLLRELISRGDLIFDAHEDGDAWYYSFDLLDKSIKISREYSRR